MRITANLEQDTFDEAQRLTGITDRKALVQAALRALIERESARHLARLGGSEPQFRQIPRR